MISAIKKYSLTAKTPRYQELCPLFSRPAHPASFNSQLTDKTTSPRHLAPGTGNSVHGTQNQAPRPLQPTTRNHPLQTFHLLLITATLSCSATYALDHSYCYPAWWTEYNIITTNALNNKALLNQGQIKWFTRKAYEAINDTLPGPANTNIQQLVEAFTDANNYKPANIGQLKYLASPFYDRLFDFGLAGNYPWIGNPELNNDYNVATVCDIKHIFGYDLPATTNFYYVSPDGSNENPGTFSEPFQTIQHAADIVVPGNTVFIREGTYRETVTLTANGTEEQPITFMAYADEEPIIKGSDIITNWIHYQDNIWMVTNWTINAQQVFDNGILMQQIGYAVRPPEEQPFWYPRIGENLSDMFPGSFYWDEENLYVWRANNEAPPAGGLEVSTRKGLLYAWGSHLIIKGLKLSHSIGPINAASSLGEHSTMKDCEISWCNYVGTFIRSSSKVIKCNYHNNGAPAISANNATNYLIHGSSIISNNYRHLDTNWNGAGMKMMPDSAGTIEHCDIGHNFGSGIWYDTCNSGVPITIRNNYIHDNSFIGIYVEVSSTAQVYNNLVLNNSSGICVADSADVHVFNNTISGSYEYGALRARGGHRTEEGYALSGNRFYNNLLYNNTSIFDLLIPRPNEHIWDNKSDYNCIFRADGNEVFATHWTNRVSTLQEWQALSGGDSNSLVLNPGLQDPEAGEYAPTSNSPLIDHGTNTPRVLEYPFDQAGYARIISDTVDIGCYESCY